VRLRQLNLFALVFPSRVKAARTSPRSRPENFKEGGDQSDPGLKGLWLEVRQDFFPARPDLDEYIVTWSRRRQRRVLASCNIRLRKVLVARELNHPPCTKWLRPLLYHEMCHAYLGEKIEKRGGKRAWHGKEFRSLEARHPEIPLLDEWIRSGGWRSAVLSERSRSRWRRITP
jgi:hypothetical protein